MSSAAASTTPLADEVTIIGAGPAGLMAACLLRQAKWNVEVLDQRFDVSARPANAASYNLTLTPAGRFVLAQADISMQDCGRPIVGRRILDAGGKVHGFRYGAATEDYLLSVPRHELIGRLCDRARSLGANIVGGVHVIRTDPTQGDVVVEEPSRALSRLQRKHLIAADGVYSTCRNDVVHATQAGMSLRDNGVVYTTLDIPTGEARASKLDPSWIHFSSGPGTMVIGLPNADESFSLVVEWSGGHTGTVEDRAQAEEILARFSLNRLIGLVPDATTALVGRRVRKFSYVACQRWETGRILLMGDAAHAMPPYLGAGVNTALVDAFAFAKAVERTTSFEEAACAYERERQEYVGNLDSLARQHEDALVSGEWGGPRWRLRQRIDRAAEQLLGRRTIYQHLIFDAPTKCVRGQIR